MSYARSFPFLSDLPGKIHSHSFSFFLVCLPVWEEEKEEGREKKNAPNKREEETARAARQSSPAYSAASAALRPFQPRDVLISLKPSPFSALFFPLLIFFLSGVIARSLNTLLPPVHTHAPRPSSVLHQGNSARIFFYLFFLACRHLSGVQEKKKKQKKKEKQASLL